MKYVPNTKEELIKLVDDESINLGDIDTSKITDMSELFFESNRQDFSGIETWDTSNVINMSAMFRGCAAFDYPIGNWDVSHVRLMDMMFTNASSFNQDISSWNTSNVINMSNMFAGAKNFNKPVNSFNTSNVTNMSGMFLGASSFNQPLDSWNTSNVTDMSSMFQEAYSFNQSLDSLDFSNVFNVEYMFWKAKSYNHGVEHWNLRDDVFSRDMFSDPIVDLVEDLNSVINESLANGISPKAVLKALKSVTLEFKKFLGKSL